MNTRTVKITVGRKLWSQVEAALIRAGAVNTAHDFDSHPTDAFIWAETSLTHAEIQDVVWQTVSPSIQVQVEDDYEDEIYTP